MVNELNNVNNNDILLRLEKEASLLSNKQNNVPDNGAFATDLSSALHKLSDLDNSVTLREHAIRNGKAIIANWQPPSDQQIDKIIKSLQKDL